MSFRGSLMAILAASFAVGFTGCADTAKDERAALVSQNAQWAKENEELKKTIAAQQNDLEVARKAASTPTVAGTDTGTPSTPGMTSENGTILDVGVADLKGAGITKGRSAKGETTFEIGSDILFDSGRSTLKPEAKRSLDKLVSVLKSQYKGGHFRVEGHTDSIPFKKGSTMTNEKLGQNRANAVIEYLAAHGISRAQLVGVSMADREPKSKTNPAANRRVTLAVAK